MEVIDEALRYVFKEKTVDLIFQFLKRNNGLSREQIPYNIEEFSSALTDLMGSSAHVLEALVTKFLYFKLQLKYNEPSEIDFTEHMKKLREKLQRIK